MMVQQELTRDLSCDELWDLVRQSKGLPSSSTYGLEFTSNNLRDWTGFLKKGNYIGVSGGSGDIHEGTWTNLELPPNQRAPAVVAKIINSEALDRDPVRAKKMIKRELRVWLSLQQKLEHANILPFVGISYDFSEQDRNTPMLISIYMQNGSLKMFSKSHLDFDFHPLLAGIARGLDYLHNFVPGIVHGDLKASNILVTPQFGLCICDFGISRMLTNETLWATSSVRAPGTFGWMAPELLIGTQTTVTKESDIFALAITIVEAFSRESPVALLNEDVMITRVAFLDQRPPRPAQMKDRLWELIQQCWQKDPARRPGIRKVLEVLESIESSYISLVDPGTPAADPHGDDQVPKVLGIADKIEFAGIPDISGEVEIDRTTALAAGGFADVYRGYWNSTRVAIKVTRSFGWGPTHNLARQVAREIRVWQGLNHENILPFLGIAFGPFQNGLPSLVSPWMKNGPILAYLNAKKGRPNITDILLQIAKGMAYLHEFDPVVIHGDLKGTNILVDDSGVMKLTDFGISKMLTDETLWRTTTSAAKGSLRWMAPELIIGAASGATVESDSYAYGMTALEIVTGQPPFSQYSVDAQVLVAIALRDERPPRPPNMKDWLWTLITRCWAKDPAQRLTMRQVMSRIQGVQQRLAELMNELVI